MASLFDNPSFQLLDRVSGKIAISVTKNGIGFSKQTLSLLEYSHYVQIFIDKNNKLIGIRKCEMNAEGAIKFVPEGRNKVNSLRWNNPVLTNTVKSLVSKEISENNFVCEGEFLNDEDTPSLLFDFKKVK